MAKKNPIDLDLKEISEKPGPYCMSFGFDLQPLVRSIEKFGLTNSPIVTRNRGGRVDVVAGYRRILALTHLQWKKVPCRDLSDAGLSPLQLLLLNLYDNLATRRFNEVEKGMILNRLIRLVPREEILRDFMPLLELPSHEPTLETFLKLEELDQTVKESLAHARISFQTVEALAEMNPDSRAALIKWLLNLKLNLNQQLQFIENTVDLSIRKEKEISELLGETQFSSILDDKKLNNPQKAKSVLGLLRSMRFPYLTRCEKAFQEKVSSLGLPDGMRVSHPPSFEGPDYRLEILFRDGEQLKGKIEVLRNMTGLETLGDPWQEEEA